MTNVEARDSDSDIIQPTDMNSLNPTGRALRGVPTVFKRVRQSNSLSNGSHIAHRFSRCLSYSPSSRAPGTTGEPPKTPLDPVTLHRLEAERRAYYKRRSYYSGAGFVAGMIAIWLIATSIDLPPKPTKLDSPSSISKKRDDTLNAVGKTAVLQKLGEESEENDDVVETGTSTVPTFPRLLGFTDGDGNVGAGTTQDGLLEYQLIGLGIRTVSFLGIQVYVAGIYIAKDDIEVLQEALIRRIDPIATTLVAGEKDKLAAVLMDPEKGEEVWNHILKDTGIRTVTRVVPTRDTDFGHLRDGWVRAITSRAKKSPEEFGDEEFGASVNNFKALFRKGRVPRKKELLLARNKEGVLAIWYDDGKVGSQRLGDVKDERISRAIWLNYLAGKTVASEGLRKNVIHGVMEFVERPVGTVAAQTHV